MKRVLPRSLFVAIFTASCILGQIFAIDPNRTFSQYIHDQWGAQNGFSGGQVSAFAQTPDGYLWIGTTRGLFRFDGLTFTSAQTLDPAFPSITNVLGMTTDGEGSLWICTQGSVLRYRNSSFEDLTANLAPGSFITAMSRTADGNIVLANLPHGEILSERSGFKSLVSSSIFQTSLALALAQTSDGRLWIGTRGSGLFYLSDGRLNSITEGLPDRKINALSPMRNGELWIGTDNGLAIGNGTTVSVKGIPPTLKHVQISALMQDHDGNLWAGTSIGLVRFNSTDHSVLVESNKDSPEEITALYEDHERNIWIGSSQGIERLRDSTFVTYTTSEGLPSQTSGPISVDSELRTWFGPLSGGLYWVRDGHVNTVIKGGPSSDVIYSISGAGDQLWVGKRQGGLTRVVIREGSLAMQTYTVADGLAQNSVYTVHESRDGSVWAGTLSGGVSHLKDSVFTTYTTANGLTSNSIASIQEGTDGTMWFATSGGLNALSNGRIKTYTVDDGLPSSDVLSLLEDANGVLWIGTTDGLAIFSVNKIRGAQGLPESLHEPIFGLAEDRKGWLWVSTSDHVLKVNRTKLMSGTLQQGDIYEYGLMDGLKGTEGVRRDRSVVSDALGRIWFSLNRGISVVDPERAEEAYPAIPHIEGVSADERAVSAKGAFSIARPPQRLVFSYTGVNLIAPERTQFRYMLEGFEHRWSDATSTRQAVYTNLSPGPYRFRVASTNSEGVWDGSEAAISFRIEPAFWQTWWFQVVCFLTLVLLAWMFYHLRIRQISRAMQSRLEERLEERERIARDLHDTLLQGFVSATMQLDVANDRLAADSPAKPIVERVIQLMQQVSVEGRNTIRSLRSPKRTTVSIEDGLSQVGEEFTNANPVDFRVVAEGLPRLVHQSIRHEVDRIGREAVTNAFRHSGASRIEVEVEYAARYLRIVVRDDGRGINPEVLKTGREGHWGLSGMRERAEQIGAKLGVSSRSGTGTEVEVVIPGQVAYEFRSSHNWLRWLLRSSRRNVNIDRPRTK